MSFDELPDPAASISSIPESNTMEPTDFRSITPIPRFELDRHGVDFSHSGEFKEGTYRIRITRYEPGTPDYRDLMECAKPIQGWPLVVPVYTESSPTYGLIVDLSQVVPENLAYPMELLGSCPRNMYQLRLCLL